MHKEIITGWIRDLLFFLLADNNYCAFLLFCVFAFVLNKIIEGKNGLTNPAYYMWQSQVTLGHQIRFHVFLVPVTAIAIIRL